MIFVRAILKKIINNNVKINKNINKYKIKKIMENALTTLSKLKNFYWFYFNLSLVICKT